MNLWRFRVVVRIWWTWLRVRHWFMRPGLKRAFRENPCVNFDDEGLDLTGTGAVRFYYDPVEFDIMWARAKPTVVPYPLLTAREYLERECEGDQ